MNISPNEVGNSLKISGAIDINEAAALRDALLAGLTHPDRSFEVDLSLADKFDAATLQLLVAARKSAEKRGRTYRLRTLSDAVAATCSELGLAAEELGIARS